MVFLCGSVEVVEKQPHVAEIYASMVFSVELKQQKLDRRLKRQVVLGNNNSTRLLNSHDDDTTTSTIVTPHARQAMKYSSSRRIGVDEKRPGENADIFGILEAIEAQKSTNTD
ncbi:hypothetical protein Pmar_PMAR002522 [Perkinsus marinus ATCC 50983]|uniref:Uncharacterized protein n=1 Tax=Perkinsus marinus (strain ATCC 50983 / TXsc) TaxID=423536 RepID=C5LV10_PERM5|nr:hypothetical protein Pmar_PMAR002522 [Perkinsus marinus ATCC 50983]EEQ99425.1 hypothetical protein Pmar_PMAR002522 [Perkinsus marinus ATCC 50983]|eukprot:XP_002766708.1 hypothetical protein Pmar_PMAR002522 [Perkinsus marinus ATCC 50983]